MLRTVSLHQHSDVSHDMQALDDAQVALMALRRLGIVRVGKVAAPAALLLAYPRFADAVRWLNALAALQRANLATYDVPSGEYLLVEGML